MAHDAITDIVKGYKVTDGARRRLIGVACSTLEELKTKGCKKLQIEADLKKLEVVLSDGTIVEDETYFRMLPSQTLLILKKPGETVLRGVDIMYGALKSLNTELLRTASEVRQFFDEDVERKLGILSRFISEEKETQRASLSRKCDDPDWFKDLETYANTKETYMRKRCSGRIQRYFYDAKEKIRNSRPYAENAVSRRLLDALMAEFVAALQRDEYFAYFFDRRCAERGAICDQNGLFVCQGLWNSECCAYAAGDASASEHRINPYSSREQRVVFTTWNLDHRIERSRTIVPAILEATEKCCQEKGSKINARYFYDLLFTLKNLKLVHIVCHDKSEHSVKCDDKQIVIRSVNNHQKNKRCPRRLNYGMEHKRPRRIVRVRP